MNEQNEMTMSEEPTATRRVIAKGAAATGLAALFASVASGRILADEGQDDDDPGDTTPDDADEQDTMNDDDTADDKQGMDGPSGTAVSGTSRKRSRNRGRKRGRR